MAVTVSGGRTASAAETARELRTLVGRLRRRLQELGDARDLTASQLSLLSRLSREGPATASALAAAERVRPQSTAATLAALVERGMVRRRADPDDGRRLLVSLTPAGRDVVEDRRRVGQQWLTDALQDRLTAEERATVLTALTLLERVTA